MLVVKGNYTFVENPACLIEKEEHRWLHSLTFPPVIIKLFSNIKNACSDCKGVHELMMHACFKLWRRDMFSLFPGLP